VDDTVCDRLRLCGGLARFIADISGIRRGSSDCLSIIAKGEIKTGDGSKGGKVGSLTFTGS